MIPAISHQPVMLEETIQALDIIPEGVYVDGTLGRAGHAQEILKRLNEKGRLICLDKDPEAIDFGKKLFAGDPRVCFFHRCFSDLAQIISQCNLKNKINGILLDLGVSSPQLEEADRGFSFMREGPLDMRMDPSCGISAKEWVNTASASEIIQVLREYGEEANAKRIARNICEARKNKPLETTLELANLVAASFPARKWCKNPATKTFQAIRIHINQELAAIDQVLTAAEAVLAPYGRLAMISFHSLEDRKVKQYFRTQSRVKLPKGIAIPEAQLVTPLKWIIKRQRPTAAEIAGNPRARSATLRVAQKWT